MAFLHAFLEIRIMRGEPLFIFTQAFDRHDRWSLFQGSIFYSPNGTRKYAYDETDSCLQMTEDKTIGMTGLRTWVSSSLDRLPMASNDESMSNMNQ